MTTVTGQCRNAHLFCELEKKGIILCYSFILTHADNRLSYTVLRHVHFPTVTNKINRD